MTGQIAASTVQELLQKQDRLAELRKKQEIWERRIRELREEQESEKKRKNVYEMSYSEWNADMDRQTAEMNPLYKQLDDVKREIEQLLGK